MDDLSGLSWASTPPANTTNGQSSTNGDRYGSLKPSSASNSRQPSPLSSGRVTPANQSSNTPKSTGQDSFANLLSTGNAKKSGSLTLQERQKQLLDEKSRQVRVQQQQHETLYKSNDTTFWEGLGSGRSTPANTTQQTSVSAGHIANDEDDILAAFNASAPVDSSSHFPPPKHTNGTLINGISKDQSNSRLPADPSPPPQSRPAAQQSLFDDDDDPFGLNELASRAPPRQAVPKAVPDDDDILGELGKPVAPKGAHVQPELQLDRDDDEEAATPSEGHPQDQAIAELVDMGFDPQRARKALEQTSDGMDVQGAVSWLLRQAHEDSRSKSKPRPDEAHQPSGGRRRRGSARDERFAESGQAGARQATQPDRTDGRSPAAADVTQYASQVGSQLFKSANSLWKTGQKRVQKAMAEMNQDVDDSQPRWMREAELRAREEKEQQARPPQRGAAAKAPDVTDEAMMLEPGLPPARRSDIRTVRDPRSAPTQREQRPAFMPEQEAVPRTASSTRERISRQAVEEQSAQAYTSPARRRKATPVQEPKFQPTRDSTSPPAPPKAVESMDIFSDMSPAPPRHPIPSQTTSQSASKTSKLVTPVSVRPKATQRPIPPTSPSALAKSSQYRAQGTAAFKRGDYASATTSYAASLSALPSSHPIAIILHANLALTQLKTGDAKAAFSSSDTAIRLIGPAQGTSESISITNEDGEPEEKPMREFYGKALTRKAEALEHLEKWPEAAQAWREAVEAGFGGAISIRARQRCEKAASGVADVGAVALTGRATPKVAPKKPAPVRKSQSAANDLAAATAPPSEAVTRLRAANAAAEAASDEQFALNDSVSARITGWKNGKEGNLRALLASLDTVLWGGANWTKVGMGDLVLPNKCKIIYMKAIGRVHPDKIPQDATTEQKMVSASVFATLNEAWDKFKQDNNL